MNLNEVINELEARLPGGIDPQRVQEIFGDSLAEDLPEHDARNRIIEGCTTLNLTSLREVS
jgi:hypothetical protein